MEGTPFGRYRLVELLGRGGMGEVWRAYDPTMDRMVALKVLPANFADDRVFQERFRREARAAAGLDEPHVVPFHDFGEVDGQLYVTMRLIEGRDLQTVLADGPLSPERAVRIIEQVAKALQAAHRIGLIHRDIKPSNILLAEDDFAYLIDFGIARAAGETGLTNTGAAIGTWAYMSPERLNTGHADARADIYALACVLHEALTGQRPYPGDSLEQQIVGHLTSPPPRPSMLQPGVPQPMDAVIAKGMAKQPDRRYATTMELARAARDATTVPLPRPGPTVPVPPSSQRDLPAAGPIHYQATQFAASGTTPMPRPPLPPPPEQEPTRLAEAAPHAGSPGNRPQPRRGPSAVVIALVGVALLIGGLLVFFGTRLSQPKQTSSSSSTVTITPNTQNTSAPNSSVPTTPPTTTTPPPTSPTTPSAIAPGDLGLPTPMSRPACDGTGIVVLGNATDPGSYPADVQRLLNEYPGASYLRTDQSCPSLRQSLNGNPIYAVYRVAGRTEADICAAVRGAGGQAYGKWLDTSSDPNSYIRQSC